MFTKLRESFRARFPVESEQKQASPAREILEAEFSAFRIPADERTRLLSKYEDYADGITRIVKEQWGILPIRAMPEKLLFAGISEAFYGNLKAKSGSGNCMTDALRSGEFNCYNSTMLFADVCARLGKNVEVVVVPNHILLAGKKYILETTVWPENSVSIRDVLPIRYKRLEFGGDELLKAVGYSWIGIRLAPGRSSGTGLRREAGKGDEGNSLDRKGESAPGPDEARKNGEAIAFYDKAIALRPELITAWNNKGAALSRLKRIPESVACYDKVIAIDPKDADAYANKGTALIKMGKTIEATEALQTCLSIDPDHKLGLSNMGFIFLHNEEYRMARDCLDRAVKADPKCAVSWLNLAQALDGMHAYVGAIKAYAKVVELDPGYGGAWRRKGHAHMNECEFEEAIACYKRALEIDPDDSLAAVKLARAEYDLECSRF